MEILVKETTTLHKVLSKYLPVDDVQVCSRRGSICSGLRGVFQGRRASNMKTELRYCEIFFGFAKYIMGQFFASFTRKLTEGMRKLKVAIERGKKRSVFFFFFSIHFEAHNP